MARADRPPTRLARWARVFPLPVPQVATVVAVTVLAGAVAASSVVAAQDEAAQDRAMVRADAAATARLTGQAAQYAAAQDRDAREAALLALDEAQAVLTSAPTFVGEETVEPLDAAVTELTTLVEDLVQAPAPPVIDDGPVSAVADAGSTTTPAPTDDATVALAQDRAEVLDLDSSEDLLAAAERVMALATQVEALSDLVATELADAEEAAAARRAEEDAKRAAAREAAWSRAAAAPNGGIPADLLCRPSFTDVQLLCEAAEALDALNEAHRAELGTDLVLVSGYRTLAQQYDVRATRGGLAARPGTSNHGRGLAVDFAGFGAVGQFDDPDYLWMVDNGPRFGWVHPPAMDPGGSGPLEPWHWEYAGH